MGDLGRLPKLSDLNLEAGTDCYMVEVINLSMKHLAIPLGSMHLVHTARGFVLK